MKMFAKGLASLAALGLAACGAQPTDQAAVDEELAVSDVSAAAEMAEVEVEEAAAEALGSIEPLAEEEAEEEQAAETPE